MSIRIDTTIEAAPYHHGTAQMLERLLVCSTLEQQQILHCGQDNKRCAQDG